MIRKTRRHRCELAVIGAGIAGCAASVFARTRGIDTVQVGNTGALAYTSGYLDLLGMQDGDAVLDPWSALASLRQREPRHPYSRLSDREIRDAFTEFTEAISEMGLHYTHVDQQNRLALLPAGVIKPTASVPETMAGFSEAMIARAPVLILDFTGLQGFSAKELVANLGPQWPALRAATVSFPEIDTHVQVFPEVLARALEVPATREAFAALVRPLIGDAAWVAMPAILGIHQPDRVHADIERLLGVPVFEIPTIPPAIAGIRLRELLEQGLAARGATIITQRKVTRVTFDPTAVLLEFDDAFGHVVIEADNVLLASGRFLSGGLAAERERIRETLLDLPLKQPADRDAWFNEHCFATEGHAINRAGVEVNVDFQPIDTDGAIIDQRLYAAGIVLAHQDWIRQRCGAGIAIASAYRVIASIERRLAH